MLIKVYNVNRSDAETVGVAPGSTIRDVLVDVFGMNPNKVDVTLNGTPTRNLEQELHQDDTLRFLAQKYNSGR
jgi:hypothetical protein